MQWLCDTLWPVLVLLSGGTIGYSIAVLHRVSRGLRAAPPVEKWADATAPASGWPSVCVVVPAHDEESVVGRLVESLLAQDYPSLRVVFALDRCNDGTRAVIERAAGGDGRVEIVEIESCPADWAGKTHAAHRGVRESVSAKGADCLLFTDADTWFDPNCVRAAVAAMRERRVGMLSLLSTLDVHSVWERVLQPAAVMALMRQHPLDRVNSPRSRRAFANGQFMLFESSLYGRIGGHEAVKEALLEDIAFAYALKNSEIPWAVLPAGMMLRCRMYESRRAFLDGWRRIYLESARRMPGRLRGWGAEFVLTGVVLPLASVLAVFHGVTCTRVGGPGAWAVLGFGVIAVGFWFAATSRVWKMQRVPLWSAVFAPYGMLVVAGVMFAAARDLTRRRTVRWGGREYTLEPRQE